VTDAIMSQMGSDSRAQGAHSAIDLDRGPGTCVFQKGLDVTQYESGIHGEVSPRQGLLVIPHLWPAGQQRLPPRTPILQQLQSLR